MKVDGRFSPKTLQAGSVKGLNKGNIERDNICALCFVLYFVFGLIW